MGMIQMAVLGWLVAINLVTFAAVWTDKRRAQKGKWRVKEWTLWKMGFLGGVWGLVFGMRRFRHKTRKGSFIAMVTLIVLVNAIYYYLIFVEFRLFF